MFCHHCGKELADNSAFCTNCGTNQIAKPTAFEYQKTAGPSSVSATGTTRKKQRSKGLLFGACGIVIGAVILFVILFTAGIITGSRIEGPGFGSPEDAAKAYLAGLRDQDMNAMVSAFAVETYADHYNFEAFLKRLNAYTPNSEMRLPNTNDYTRQMNIESRRSRIVNQILNQYLQFQVPDAFKDGETTSFENIDISDFAEEFEKDTKDYVFKDLSIVAILNMQDLPDNPSWDDIEDLIPKDVLDDLPADWMEIQLEGLAQAYKMERNQDNIAQIAEIYDADIKDIANVAVFFKADNKTWVFFPEMIRYNGKWYIDSLQGNLASLAGLSVFMGGIMPIG